MPTSKSARRRQWHRTFTYTITDSDGDTSTANLVLQIHNNDDPVVISGLDVNGGELTVYEKNLSDGSAPVLGTDPAARSPSPLWMASPR
jgi:hypothetical protein